MTTKIPAADARKLRYGFVALPSPAGDGYDIVFPDIPGISSYAETLEDVPSQVQEMLDLTFEEAEAKGWLVEAPSPYPDDRVIRWGQPQQPERDPSYEPRVTTGELAEEWGISRRQINAKARRLGIGRVVGSQRMFTKIEVDQVRPRSNRGRPPKESAYAES